MGGTWYRLRIHWTIVAFTEQISVPDCPRLLPRMLHHHSHSTDIPIFWSPRPVAHMVVDSRSSKSALPGVARSCGAGGGLRPYPLLTYTVPVEPRRSVANHISLVSPASSRPLRMSSHLAGFDWRVLGRTAMCFGL